MVEMLLHMNTNSSSYNPSIRIPVHTNSGCVVLFVFIYFRRPWLFPPRLSPTCCLRAKKILYAEAMLNVVCINANGLRTRRQKTFLNKLLTDLHVGVCVVTETHLRKKDLKTIDMENYVLLADSCRPAPVGEMIKGGVIILAHAAFTAYELPSIKGLNPRLEHCAIKFFSQRLTRKLRCESQAYTYRPRIR